MPAGTAAARTYNRRSDHAPLAMSFLQDPPQLPDPWRSDRVLRGWLDWRLAPARRAGLVPHLEALAAHALATYREQQITPHREPVLTQWDAWGARVDRIALTAAWECGPAITTRHGLLWAGHQDNVDGGARADQFARVYLYHCASEFHTCPLAMTDGAIAALEACGERALLERVLPRYLSRDPATLWLSGQWMTETPGGSDVAHSETVARRDSSGQWRLYGRKWFSSAVVGEAALALARPEGAGDGGSALGLFHAETRDAAGNWSCLRIQRLKGKLGTRELPTAEIELDGVPAWPLGEPAHGVRKIAPMLNVTRLWSTLGALATARRALALAGDYATRRQAFGRELAAQPLHRETLADIACAFEAAFHLAFHAALLLGRVEAGVAAPDETAALRLLIPLAKLWVSKLSVSLVSECLEAFGGAGYIEDTGLPQLLRDVQVFPIWEGTTNVLALDLLRALGRHGLAPLRAALTPASAATDPVPTQTVRGAFDAAERWLDANAGDRDRLEAGARRLGFTLARTCAAALLAEHAVWSGRRGDARPAIALTRFLARGLDRLPGAHADGGALLTGLLSRDAG